MPPRSPPPPPNSSLSDIATSHARRKEALQREADAHERAALTEAAPRLASLLADAANQGAHAVHEAQTLIAAEAALLSRELARLSAQLPAWATASQKLHEALKHAGDVAHFARRVSAETRALEEVLAEDEGEEKRAAAARE